MIIAFIHIVKDADNDMNVSVFCSTMRRYCFEKGMDTDIRLESFKALLMNLLLYRMVNYVVITFEAGFEDFQRKLSHFIKNETIYKLRVSLEEYEKLYTSVIKR